MKVRVRTTRQADEQALRVADWWREHRAAAPTVFVDELIGAIALLEDAPDIGRRYRRAKVPGLRRLLLPRSAHHVYYVHDATAGEVVLLAMWAAVRRAGVPLH